MFRIVFCQERQFHQAAITPVRKLLNYHK
jgi:hypothetical protein